MRRLILRTRLRCLAAASVWRLMLWPRIKSMLRCWAGRSAKGRLCGGYSAAEDDCRGVPVIMPRQWQGHWPCRGRLWGWLIAVAAIEGWAAPAASQLHETAVGPAPELAASGPASPSSWSLHFRDLTLRAALQTMADFGRFNLVVADEIQGRVNLRLQQVAADQALAILVDLHGLAQREHQGVQVIALPGEAVEVPPQQQQADWLTELFPLRYSDAQTLKELLQEPASAGQENSGSWLAADRRTNTLLVRAPASRMAELRELLTRMDVPARQVLIEASIAVVDSKYARRMGIRWGGSGSSGRWRLGSDASGRNKEENDSSLLVDLGLGAVGGASLAIGYAGSRWMLDLELNALESSGHAQVISRPRIITGDRQQATIKSGNRIPYQRITENGATAVEFEDAALKLDVIPRIAPDGRIMLQLSLNQDSVAADAATSNGVPIIDTTQLITQVLARSGETVVLGGVFKMQDRVTKNRVPLLGDLPILGPMFRRDEKQRVQSEAMIFITPTILGDEGLDG